MDTFDGINSGAFGLIFCLLVARATFWKRRGEIVSFWVALPDILLGIFAYLDLSLWHHWHMPYRRRDQFILYSGAMLVTAWKLAQTLLKERQKAKEKQAQKAGRRYY